jgi:hypothetical protein
VAKLSRYRIVDIRRHAGNFIAFQFCPKCGRAFRRFPHASTKSVSATSTVFAVSEVSFPPPTLAMNTIRERDGRREIARELSKGRTTQLS